MGRIGLISLMGLSADCLSLVCLFAVNCLLSIQGFAFECCA